MSEQQKKSGRRKRSKSSLFAAGEPMVWMTGGSLVLSVLMITGLLLLILCAGMSTFWPRPLHLFETVDGGVYMGEETRQEVYERAGGSEEAPTTTVERRLVRTGNFRITQTHFKWLDADQIKDESLPKWGTLVERLEWGRFYGFPQAFAVLHPNPSDLPRDKAKEHALAQAERLAAEHGGEMRIHARVFDGDMKDVFLSPVNIDRATEVLGVAEYIEGPEAAWRMFEENHGIVRGRWHERRKLEKVDIGEINAVQEQARLRMREAELDLRDTELRDGAASDIVTRDAYREAAAELETVRKAYDEACQYAQQEFLRIRQSIKGIDDENARYVLEMKTAGEGKTAPVTLLLTLDEVVRAYQPNQLTRTGRLGLYLSRWHEYLLDEPREANSEGGVYPAIFGTVLMTLLMAIAVVPFGVLAAMYLREYAKSGPIVSAVRIAVNNLAGVPSIVFGVFGLGFFCYGVGGYLDAGPAYAMPKPSWFAWLAGLAVSSVGASFAFMMGVAKPGKKATLRQIVFRRLSLTLWLLAASALVILVATTPFFDGFYRSHLPNPTFGKGALLWASLTLALLTLPVVIVATEEALSSVPNSMREGSYACGASKWQTIKRIVLPRAMPGIMTGAILAMARGAGEVAPLMLVGAVKLAPELPFAWHAPFGMNRSFMHLGFHIYDVGFQSQNSEAAKPMVFTTALLLITIVALLNIAAIWLRTRLKRKFVRSQF